MGKCYILERVYIFVMLLIKVYFNVNKNKTNYLYLLTACFAWCAFVHRARRAMENRGTIDDERIENLEEHLKRARAIAEEREMMYEEVRN